MSLRAPLFLLTSILLLAASPALAQPGALQDSTLDNLVHAKGYVTSAAGALGAVVDRGKGPLDMVLVSGFGMAPRRSKGSCAATRAATACSP